MKTQLFVSLRRQGDTPVRAIGEYFREKTRAAKAAPFLRLATVLQYAFRNSERLNGLAASVDGLFQLGAGNELRNFLGRNF